MTTKHKPTSPAHREAVLRDQARRLLQDAATWGYAVTIEGRTLGREYPRINVYLDPIPCSKELNS